MSVLLLNASYEALGFVSWRRAIVLVLSERAELVEYEDDRVVRSAGGTTYPFPVVVRLVSMIRARRGTVAPFNRRNLELRDGGQCQVRGCSAKGTTVDHVVPRSQGGTTTWSNCVLMCRTHNGRKGDTSLARLGWSLKQRPTSPPATLVLSHRAATRPEWGRWVAAHMG